MSDLLGRIERLEATLLASEPSPCIFIELVGTEPVPMLTATCGDRTWNRGPSETVDQFKSRVAGELRSGERLVLLSQGMGADA